MNVIKLYFFEHVDGNTGLYSRTWAETKDAAEAARADMLNDGWHYEPDEEEGLTGEYGQVGPVDDVLVELSTAGIIGFANHYAIGGGD